jgi:enoyl-CoA hydratase
MTLKKAAHFSPPGSDVACSGMRLPHLRRVTLDKPGISSGNTSSSRIPSSPRTKTPMQMINSHCGIDRDARGVVRLTICNAGSLNILGSAAINGVREGIEKVATEPDTRVLVIAGQSEKSMIGGADIKEMARLGPSSAEKFITGLSNLCEAARTFPAPVIARIPGWCLGGGLEFAAACDFRIATHDARFGMPEVRVGIPSVIHAALLPRLIGWGRARWLVMTAENIDAPTALAWGLIDGIAAPGGLDDAVERTVAMLLECAPQALKAQKALLRQWEELPLRQSIDLSVGVFAQSYLTGEPQRLMQAFIDRKR